MNGEADVDLETALSALERVRHPFPEDAVRWAIENPGEVTAPLLDALREPPSRTLERDRDYLLNIYAQYLLAQFREVAACEPIIDYYAAITEAEDGLIDEVVTEDLHRILASVHHGRDASLRRLIEEPTVNDWVRGAAIRTYTALLVAGQMTRSEVVDYFRYLLDSGLERTWSYTWDALAGACSTIHPEGLMPSLERAYREDFIDPGYISLENLQSDLAMTPEQTLDRSFAYRTPLIEDTILELSNWACFRPREPKKSPAAPPPAAWPDRSTVTKGPKIGRNDLCPCGSGKKYKKCCLPKGLDYRQS